MHILIGGAWPYANGSLHIGHIASLLPGDVLARYHRARGDTVYYVSGSDCHGTPVAIRAQEEGRTPREISDFYHEEFCGVFRRFGFSYDRYGRTSSDEHRDFVTRFHAGMYESPYIYERTAPQAWCPVCRKVLSDRWIVGRCPVCGKPTRGDQCEACGAVPEPESLPEAACAVCGTAPVFRESRHLYVALSKMEKRLRAYIDGHPEWRKNALAFSRRYLDEGLRDRAVTRDLDWGIDVPKAGYEDKKIYIWAENVLGYLSMSDAAARERGEDPAALWNGETRHYYVHGKDNIPFHSIVLPGLMIANGGAWRLPDVIVSSEYLTLEGRKISTSAHWAVWAKDILERFEPDSLRYFFLANGPEKRDCDFSFREYVKTHNGELVGAWGNFVQRTLAFVEKYFGGAVPEGPLDPALAQKTAAAFVSAGESIERAELKEALAGVFALVREANRYYDAREPWKTRTEAPESCRETIFNCVQLAGNLAVLLHPFLPFTSERAEGWLGLSSKWERQAVPAGHRLPAIGHLFARLGPEVAERETARLGKGARGEGKQAGGARS